MVHAFCMLHGTLSASSKSAPFRAAMGRLCAAKNNNAWPCDAAAAQATRKRNYISVLPQSQGSFPSNELVAVRYNTLNALPPRAHTQTQTYISQGSFPSNELVTARYNALTFLPVNLYSQFKRVANLYFLALVCLQVCCGDFEGCMRSVLCSHLLGTHHCTALLSLLQQPVLHRLRPLSPSGCAPAHTRHHPQPTTRTKPTHTIGDPGAVASALVGHALPPGGCANCQRRQGGV